MTTKFSVVLSDGSVHDIESTMLRVDHDDGTQDIPMFDVTDILTMINAGQQLAAKMLEYEVIGNIGSVEEVKDRQQLDAEFDSIVSRLFGMGDEDCQHNCSSCTSCGDPDYDDNAGEADGSNPIPEFEN